MTAEVISLSVEPPAVEDVPRVIEVACGDSFVTVKQVDGRSGRRWTVYSNDGAGMNGPIQAAPLGESPDTVLPWARERARLMERERLSYAALKARLGDAIPPTSDGST